MAKTASNPPTATEARELDSLHGRELYKPKGNPEKKTWLKKHRRKLGVGGLMGILLGVIIAGLSLSPLKLLHFTQNIRDHFDAPMSQTIQDRAPRHYRIIFDKETGQAAGYEKRGSIFNYGSKVRNKLITDLKGRGLEANFDPNTGKLTGFTVNGVSQAVDDSLLFGQRRNRSLLRQTLQELYPEEGWLRRGARARALYSRYGFRLRFSERVAQRINQRLTDRQRGKQLIRENTVLENQSQFDNIPSGVTDGDGSPSEEDIDTAKATASSYAEGIEGLKEGVDELGQAIRNNPAQSFRFDADLDKALSGVFEGTVRGGLKGFFLSGYANALDRACRVRTLSQGVEEGAKVIRTAQLARYALKIMTLADQVKSGDVKGSTVNNVMGALNNGEGGKDLTSGGGWRWLQGDKNAKVSSNSLNKYGVDGGRIGLVQTLNDATSGVGSGCGVFTNFFFQAGAAIVSLGASILSLGANEAVEVAVSIGAETLLNIAQNIAEPMLSHMFAGMSVTGDETPEEVGDATVSGYSFLAGTNARSNGAKTATSAQVSQLQSRIEIAKSEELQQQSWGYRYFSFDNPYSLASQLAVRLPSSLNEAGGKVAGLLSRISLADLPSGASLATWLDPTASPVGAQSSEEIATDPFGNPIYIIPEGVSAIDPIENEDYLLANELIDEYKKFVSKCLTTTNYRDYESEECTKDTPLTLRFRAYRLDSGISEMLNEYTTGNFPNTTQAIANPADLPSGSAQKLAGDILKHPRISFDSDGIRESFRQVANSGTASLYTAQNPQRVAVNPKLLAVILNIADKKINLRISSLTTGSHADGSDHYQGAAIDFGNEEVAGQLMPYVYNNRESFAIDELIYKYPPSGTSNLNDGSDHAYSSGTLDQHANHIHLSVKGN